MENLKPKEDMPQMMVLGRIGPGGAMMTNGPRRYSESEIAPMALFRVANVKNLKMHAPTLQPWPKVSTRTVISCPFNWAVNQTMGCATQE